MSKSKKYTKNEVLNGYNDLAKKLGKLPSRREVDRFLCSHDVVVRLFGKLNELRLTAINTFPNLNDLQIPVQITHKDVDVYRLSLEAKNNKLHNKSVVSSSSTLDYIAQFSQNVFSGKIKGSTKKKAYNKQRILNLVLSDLHFGADVNSEETGYLAFGRKEEARRFAAVVEQVINYKSNHRQKTHLEVLLLGDIIQNQLHDARDGAPLAEQVCRAISLLSQGLAHLAKAFDSVSVRCATGNHGRRVDRHHDRAVNQKFDSHETIIYYSLKEALKSYKNMEFHIPKTPYVSYDVFGQKIFATHGDTVLNPGYPGKSINTKSLELQVNKINAGLPDKEEYKVFIVGHVHTGSVTFLSNGSVVLTNGSLVPTDGYGVSIGILESREGQWLFESIQGHPVGDLRFIKVGEENDKDSSLDKMIKPWDNL